jgi:hypothetical protein
MLCVTSAFLEKVHIQEKRPPGYLTRNLCYALSDVKGYALYTPLI